MSRMTNRRARRKFLKSIPLAAAALPAALTARSDPGVRPQSQTARSDRADISPDTLREAEKIDAIAFSDTERAGMTANVAANRANYEMLRTIAVDYDVEPAFRFEPLAGAATAAASAARGRATPHAPLTIDRPRLAARPPDEELAFLPLTALAALVQSRLVSSTELTELYLARLQRFGPKLECVVTRTDRSEERR